MPSDLPRDRAPAHKLAGAHPLLDVRPLNPTNIDITATFGNSNTTINSRKQEGVMNALARVWTMWIVRGIASVIFGLLTVVRPGVSIAALVFLFGFYSLTDGALLLGFAFRYDGRKAPYVVRGLVSVAAGLLTFVYPGLTAISLYVLIGAWAIAAGATELAIAFAIRRDASSVTPLVVAGLLSIGCGVALLALPIAGVIALTSLIAAYAIVHGISLIGAGIRIHQFVRPLAAA